MATSHSSVSMLSWNINGDVLNKLALLEKIVKKNDHQSAKTHHRYLVLILV